MFKKISIKLFSVAALVLALGIVACSHQTTPSVSILDGTMNVRLFNASGSSATVSMTDYTDPVKKAPLTESVAFLAKSNYFNYKTPKAVTITSLIGTTTLTNNVASATGFFTLVKVDPAANTNDFNVQEEVVETRVSSYLNKSRIRVVNAIVGSTGTGVTVSGTNLNSSATIGTVPFKSASSYQDVTFKTGAATATVTVTIDGVSAASVSIAEQSIQTIFITGTTAVPVATVIKDTYGQ